MEGAEIRLNADETAYIINLTADEARKVAALTADDTATTAFEHSVSCIGATAASKASATLTACWPKSQRP